LAADFATPHYAAVIRCRRDTLAQREALLPFATPRRRDAVASPQRRFDGGFHAGRRLTPIAATSAAAHYAD